MVPRVPVLICMSMKKQGMSFVVLPDQNAAASSLRNLANPLIADNCGSSRWGQFLAMQAVSLILSFNPIALGSNSHS